MSDLVVVNAKLATLDREVPEATAVAIREGRFLVVGGEGDVRAAMPDATLADAGGRRMVPGLFESRIHASRGGLTYNMELRGDGVPSLFEAVAKLRGQSERTPPPQWIRVVGGGAEHQVAETRLPTIGELARHDPGERGLPHAGRAVEQRVVHGLAPASPGHGDHTCRHNGAGEMLVCSAADFEDFRVPRPETPANMQTDLGPVIRRLAETRRPWRLHAICDETVGRAPSVHETIDRDIPLAGHNWFFDHAETISERNIDRIAGLGDLPLCPAANRTGRHTALWLRARSAAAAEPCEGRGPDPSRVAGHGLAHPPRPGRAVRDPRRSKAPRPAGRRRRSRGAWVRRVGVWRARRGRRDEDRDTGGGLGPRPQAPQALALRGRPRRVHRRRDARRDAFWRAEGPEHAPRMATLFEHVAIVAGFAAVPVPVPVPDLVNGGRP